MKQSYFRRKSCRLCNQTNLELVLALAATPPANAYLPKEKLNQQEEKFPLDVFFCHSCAHVQLLDVVDPEILFRDYVYVSGTSPVFVAHFQKYAEEMIANFKLTAGSNVLEIGSNDGTLLRFFKNKGCNVLGIDPAVNLAQQATQNGIKTLPEFFTPALADALCKELGGADLILANNVFAHIDDLHSVAQGVRNLLKPEGVYAFEVSYLADVVDKTLFDTIYHEHLSYHSIRPLQKFFKMNGLHLFDAERVSSHGGSLRGYVQLANSDRPETERLHRLIHAEEVAGLYKVETFKKFAANIERLKNEFLKTVASLKQSGKKLAGFGAPAKATTLMHHFGIGKDIVDFIVDDNPLKQGLFTPGLHIPIKPSSAILTEKPDYLIILAWNFADSIMAKHKDFLDQGNHFIVPVPELRII